MTDPFSVAGSAVGITSLGITVAQGLYDYYSALHDQKSDIAHTTKKLSRLLEILESLNRTLEQRQSPTNDYGQPTIISCIEDCQELIEELREELDKFRRQPHQDATGRLRAAGRRVAYPLRQSTLQKLDENVDDAILTLSLAMKQMQQSDIYTMQDGTEDTRTLLDLVRASQVSTEVKAWLMAPDATINFNEALKMKHPRTGLWFVQGSEFKDWLETPSSFLWLVGFAGCGKSVLCSTAIQYTLLHRRSNPEIGIAFFYFTFNDETKQGASAVLRSLVLQLSGQLDNSHAYLSSLRESYRDSSPPVPALMACLRQLVRAFKQVYVLIDALDESPRDKHREAMLDALADIRSWSEPGLHILVSSRDEPDIRVELEVPKTHVIKVQNEGHDDDIASCISDHLQHNRHLRKWHEHHTQIKTTLTSRAKGVYVHLRNWHISLLTHYTGSVGSSANSKLLLIVH